MLVRSFYVTTTEIDHPNREHNYRLPAGDSLPSDETLKSQRKAGEFKFAQVLSPESLATLKSVR